MSYTASQSGQKSPPQVQPCRYKTGKTLGAGSYSVVKECVHIDTGRYYAAKVINKRLMAGREHMVRTSVATDYKLDTKFCCRFAMKSLYSAVFQWAIVTSSP